MAVRTHTERELNRALLARQCLLTRSRASLTRTIERVGGLQTQYSPSGYIGLWSRLDGFERPALTRALERKAVIQGTVLRVTIHMVTKADYAPWTAAVRDERRAWWLRATRRHKDEAEMREIAARVRRLLHDGPLRRAEIADRLGLDSTTFNGVGLWVDLVRVPPSGTWERPRADRYALAEGWLGGRVRADAGAGRDLLVRRYLGAFGPAGRRDIASWAGLSVSALEPSFERLPLRRSRDESGRELFDLPRAPLPPGDTPAPVRFIATWDASLLVHARRTGIVPEEVRPLIFSTKTPQSVSTFLVDGKVAGTWRFEDGRVRTEPFEPLGRSVARELADEGARLAAFMA
ncbi:MAG: winged helix DNA-binding domain-containing protein [Actinomycetota bacterium]